MKKLFTILLVLSLPLGAFAQSPQKMSYQAVIRNTSNVLVATSPVGMRVSILQGSPSGTEIYKEIYNPNPQTNINGLVTIEIGGGIPLAGTFSGIDWSIGPYFIKTETDPLGGTNYTITGTSQLLSVPYALHSKTVASYTETDPVYIGSQAANITASDITKLSNLSGTNTGDQTLPTLSTLGGVAGNAPITGETKTKITYDTKGLVTAGTNATTADIAASTNKNYVTDAQLTVIANTSGTNTGDNATNTLYSGLVTNATHTGDATGSDALTLPTVNSNVGTFNNITINAKGLAIAGSNVSYLTTETDPIVKSITGIVMSNGTTISAAVAGDFPILNQNTTGNAATATTAGTVTTAAQPAITSVGTLTGLTVSGTTTVATPVNPTDAANKAYVDEILKTLSNNGVIALDKDGNIYTTVRIGSQVWMGENLKTTKYNDGSAIPNVTDNTAWTLLTSPGYSWYNNDIGTYKTTYGALYNWYAVNSNQLCPTGWHVPSDAELTITTETLLGGSSIAGGKLKEAGLAHWITPNTDANNSSGFSALPGGFRYSVNGAFMNLTSYGYWWSLTEYDGTRAYAHGMASNNSSVVHFFDNKRSGISVRCLKD
jgi:uncharacterized protein (TIGR02145 family)